MVSEIDFHGRVNVAASDTNAATSYINVASLYTNTAASYINGVNVPVDGGRTQSL